MIEKIVHKRIYDHLTEYDVLDKRQGGFRPKHSTAKTCAYFTEDLYTAINNKETTIAIFIDAMKAFGTVLIATAPPNQVEATTRKRAMVKGRDGP